MQGVAALRIAILHDGHADPAATDEATLTAHMLCLLGLFLSL